MPTKEEILKKHFSNNSGTPWSEIHAAMEEYAKQEALEYGKFLLLELECNNELGVHATDNQLWEAYQKSKSN